jgi:hypothetical protein
VFQLVDMNGDRPALWHKCALLNVIHNQINMLLFCQNNIRNKIIVLISYIYTIDGV